MKYYCLLFQYVCFFCVFISCNKAGDKTQNEVSPGKAVWEKNIKTVKAKLTDQDQELLLTGKVEYISDKIVNYVPLISGVVERTYFSLGDEVTKGQPLMDIKSSDISSMLAEKSAAESEAEIALRNNVAAEELYKDNMLSERELIEVKSQLKQAQVLLNKRRYDLHALGINKGNGVFTITSPISGYIVDKQVASGSSISSNSSPLFVVADLTQVWITVNIYANDLQYIQEGLPVEISSLSYPGEVFYGRLDNISHVFDPEEKIVKARIVMPNKNLIFKPEMSVVAKLKRATKSQTIAIPTDALIFDSDKYFVVIKDTTSHFQIKQVTLLGHNRGESFIGSEIACGTEIVTSNQLLIYSDLTGK